MQFQNIIAHNEVNHRLIEMVQKNRLSHALLFLGKEGSGALPLAIAFAQYILCEKVNSNNQTDRAALFGKESYNLSKYPEDSCNQCPSCIKMNQLVHPDLYFSYPALKKDSRHDKVLSTDYIKEWREFIKQYPYNNVADWINFLKESASAGIDSPVNKQGNISVNECDDISHKLSLKAFESSYKILIMWMPEYLGTSGNKLLKLIEEPPPNTLFIFVAEDESSILPTILSRLQLIKIPSYSNTEISNTLIENYDISPDKASLIAAVSEGNFREALLILQRADEDLQGLLRDWLNVIISNNINKQIKWIDQVSKTGREKQKQLLRYFIHLIRQAIRIRYLPEGALVTIPDNEKDFALRLNKICSLEAQEAMLKEMDNSIYFIERNAYAKILFHALTIRFFHIIKENSLILIH